MARIAINGLGRMGKLVLRALFDGGTPGEIVLLNDAAGDPATHAHLFEFDSVHGRWPALFGHDADGVSVNGRADAARAAPAGSRTCRCATSASISWSTAPAPSRPPRRSQPYFDAGVAKVVVSAPIKDEAALNLVYGVNHDRYDPGQAPPGDGGELHHQLPRAGGEGAARGDRHPPRLDHHHP